MHRRRAPRHRLARPVAVMVAGALLARCALAVTPGPGGSLPPGDAGVSEAACRPSPPVDASTPLSVPTEGEAAVRDAPTVALLRVDRVDEECSDAGGEHLTLSVVAAGCGALADVRTVAMGAHGFNPTPPFTVGAWVVAGVQPRAVPPRSLPTFCVMGLPAAQGEAVAFVRVGSESEGRAVMARIVSGR